MAEKRKRVGFRGKRSSGGQPSVIRFNVAEETTETVVNSVTGSQGMEATPSGKVPGAGAKQPVKNDGEDSVVESEVVVGSKNTRSGPREVTSLFDDSVGDLDLFGEQTGTYEDREATQGKRSLSSSESSLREGSTEPSHFLSSESNHVAAVTGLVSDNASAGGDARVGRSEDIEVTERLSSSELEIGRDSAGVYLDKEDELVQSDSGQEDATLQDQVATHQGESDSISMSSDHEIHVGSFDSHKDGDKLFVSEHPLASVEPSSEESEEDFEPPKQHEDSFLIIDDYYQRSPIGTAPPQNTRTPVSKIPPARPPPPKQSRSKETTDISKAKVDDTEKSDRVGAAVVERKAPAEFVYWSFKFQSLLIFSTVIFVFNTLNTSVYLSGVFDGVMWVFLTMCALLCFNLQRDENLLQNKLASLKRKAPIMSKRTRVALQPQRGLESDFAAIRFYSGPLYHQPSLTTKVHIIMDGHKIHISASEDTHMSFHRLADEQDEDGGERVSSEKILDLRGATVRLAPSDLSRKQRFSKKFPLKVTFKYSVPDISVSLCLEHSMLVHRKRGRIHDNDDRALYLFAPTSHSKEVWFWRLQLACSAVDGDSLHLTTPPHFNEYADYMCRLVPDTVPQPNKPKNAQPKKLSRRQRKQQTARGASGKTNDAKSQTAPAIPKQLQPLSIDWFNAFMGRLFWDAWKEKYLRERLHLKWQHKLNKTKTPSFMRPLTITALNLGDHLPVVTQAHGPYVNDQGIWVDLDLDYKDGTFCITLETSLNFIPVGEKDTTVPHDNMTMGALLVANSSSSHSSSSSVKVKVKRREGDSDIDSGAEEDEDRTSIDEPSLIITPPEANPKSEQKQTNDTTPQQSPSKSALLRIADKVLQSRIIRKAAQTRLGQRVTEKVNNIPLVLIVKVTSLKGCLSVSMSPPPTDRIW